LQSWRVSANRKRTPVRRTDVGLWITKLHRDIATFIHVGRVRELQTVTRQGQTLRIGAGAAWSDLEEVLGEHYPDFGELLRRFGSVQVRNAATIRRNIATARPLATPRRR
jgi:xanthine dehydrogenase small subunit